ncbi:hypothetical protein HID58_066370, partial [Brassica napus]
KTARGIKILKRRCSVQEDTMKFLLHPLPTMENKTYYQVVKASLNTTNTKLMRSNIQSKFTTP